MRKFLVALPRRQKRALQLLADVVLIWITLWLSFAVRLGDVFAAKPFSGHGWLFIAAPLIALPVFIRMGMYRAVMRYVGSDALVTIAKAVTLSSLILALVVYWYRGSTALVPRSMVFNYWWLSLLLLGGLRLLMRNFFAASWGERRKRVESVSRVAVYGAGTAGNQLVAALRLSKTLQAVAYIDSDQGVANHYIAGLRVYSPEQIPKMIKEIGVDEILLAMPNISRAQRREIFESLEPYSLLVRSIPSFTDLASGRVKVDDVQKVDITDLLGRDSVAPQSSLLERCIRNKTVMVTGAGGSIGAELCRQIMANAPLVLVLFESSEYNLYMIQSEMQARVQRDALPIKVVGVLGSVQDAGRVLDVVSTWKVDTIYHAAAYKHVPIVEHNITEGVMNNLGGTYHVALAAIKEQVENFVLVSTDKAVRPTNVMGSTKRLAEMLLQALSVLPEVDVDGQVFLNKTRFTMVRFGNVLGSSGSVIPLFREQIRLGGPVTVTHPEITRYFMTIPEAAQLVIQAGSMGHGGDVFVLDMGEPVKISALAEKMIHLSGLSVQSDVNPQGDIAIHFTGLRPGEKLYEELLIGDNASFTEHPMIMRADEAFMPWAELQPVLDELLGLVERKDVLAVRAVLARVVNGYVPEEQIVDWRYRALLERAAH